MIVCPKCRQHAQIIETGKNTLRCQRCGTSLEARRLRVFYSSGELADAVAFRTRLQAEISGKESETFSLKTSSLKTSAEGYELSKSGKKDCKSVFLELLETAGGEMQIEEFQQKALEKGISPEKFDLILKKLLEIGELYSPEPGILKLV